MKKLSEITAVIQPVIGEIESFRLEKLALVKKGQKWFAIPSVLLLLTIGAFVMGMIIPAIIIGIISVILFIAIYFSQISHHEKEYKQTFKRKILKPFVNALYPGTTLRPDSCVSSNLFRESKLFGGYDDYSGEDLFMGKTENGHAFQFSELNVTSTTRDSDGDSRTTTVFNGLFFVMDSHENVNTRVHVIPDVAEKSLGFIGKMMQKSFGSLFQGAKMVYMEEHPEFEKEFVVYAKDKEEAYRVLSPAVVGAIYNLKYKWNASVRCAFIANKFYLAVPVNTNYFEADLKKSWHKNKELENLYNELAMCFVAIEDMCHIEERPKGYDPSDNWRNSAYNHLNDTNNPFLL